MTLAAIVWGFEFARPSCECGALLGLYRSERWHGTLCPRCDEPHARELERLDNGAVH